MRAIKFLNNLNGKLNNEKFFTSIRLENDYFQLNKPYEIVLNEKLIGIATIKSIMKTPIEKLPESFCFLDTGYNKQETEKMIRSFYRGANWITQYLFLMVLEWKKKY